MKISFAALLFAFALTAGAQSPDAITREAPFAPGGTVSVDANIGDVRIEPVRAQDGAPDRLRVVIDNHEPGDEAAAHGWLREFVVNGTSAKIRLVTPKGGHHNFTIRVYVPEQTNLQVDLGVGDLVIDSVAGNTEAEVGIGDLKVTVPDPAIYRRVGMSVHIGDVHAAAFGLEPHGWLGKSVDHEFDHGRWRLRLHTGIGDVSCTSRT